MINNGRSQVRAEALARDSAKWYNITLFRPRVNAVSLRLTIIRTITLVLVVTLVVGSVLTYWAAMRKVETEVDAAMAIAEKTVRQAVQEIAHADDGRLELVRLVRVFDGNRHVKASFIDANAGGERISSFVAPAEELPDWFFNLLATPPKVVRVSLPDGLGQHGTIELEADQRGEVAEVWDDVVLKLTILTVFCALVSWLVYFTLGRALEPLGRLTAAFERVGGGDYEARVAERGPTEFAKLAGGFNEMTRRLGEMEQKNEELNEQLATVQDEERADLARDLHDEVSPFLFSVDVDASTIRKLADGGNAPQVTERAEAIREAVAHMKKHVRSILGRLRPSVPLELGLANAVESLVASWQLRNPEVTFNVDVAEESCGQKLNNVVHGIVRESLSNALKHGKPGQIDVEIVQTDEGDVVVTVRDDGGGLQPSSLSSGFGLIAMKERVGALGGSVTVRNRTDTHGVEVIARLPLRERNGVGVPEDVEAVKV